MSSISGFGKAEWLVMMGSVSFELKGVEAFAAIWPKDMMAQKPSWWPKRVADQLPPNESVTVEKLKTLLPNFSEVKWEHKPRGMANTIEFHTVGGDLRVVVMGHAKSTQGDAMREKTNDLRQAAIEFQSLIS